MDRHSNIELLLKIKNYPHHLLYKDSGSKLRIIQLSNYLITESVANEKVNMLPVLSNLLEEMFEMFEEHSKRKNSSRIKIAYNFLLSKDPIYSDVTL